MRYHELTEAPLADISVHGNPLDQEGSFSQGDRDYMAKSILKGTYKEKLKKLPFNVYVYVLNADGLDDFGTSYPEGEITWAQGTNAPQLRADPEDVNLPLLHIEEIRKIIFARLEKDKNSVHFILGDNFSDEHQMKPSPWILAHRMIHAFDDTIPAFNRAFNDPSAINRYYILKTATMASARNNKMAWGELTVELATQYLITGTISADMGKLEALCREKGGDFEERASWLNGGLRKFESCLDELLRSTAGKTYYI